MSGAAVVAPHGVLLPMHLRIQGAEGVTIDLARATVPGGLPIAALPLPTTMGSMKAKNGRLCDMPIQGHTTITSRHILRHLSENGLRTPGVSPGVKARSRRLQVFVRRF